MMLIGRIARVQRAGWLATCESLGAFTQGRSRKDAFFMLADCIECKVNRAGFKVTVTELGAKTTEGIAVLVEANEPALLVAEVLKHQRESHGLSLKDVAKKLGGANRIPYARYEQGRGEPSLSKFQEILEVVAPEMAVVLDHRAPRRKTR